MGLITRIVAAVAKPLERFDQRVKPYRRKYVNDARLGDYASRATRILFKPVKKVDDGVRRWRR